MVRHWPPPPQQQLRFADAGHWWSLRWIGQSITGSTCSTGTIWDADRIGQVLSWNVYPPFLWCVIGRDQI
jgi:hypothetical protein